MKMTDENNNNKLPKQKLEETAHRAEHFPVQAIKINERSTGNKIFDLIVYPTIAFGAVFAFSAWMLHTTKFGNGKLHQKYKGWVESLAQKFEKSGWFKNN